MGSKPFHRAVVTLGEETRQARGGFGNRIGRRDADGVEALIMGVGDKRGFQKSRSA